MKSFTEVMGAGGALREAGQEVDLCAFGLFSEGLLRLVLDVPLLGDALEVLRARDQHF